MLAKLALWSQKFSNQLIDCYLTQDSDYYQDLTTLSGKEILLWISDLSLEVKIAFTRTKMTLAYAKTLVPQAILDENHLSLQGQSSDLLAFAWQKDKRSQFLSEQLVVYQGDLFLLEALLKLLKERDFLENVPLPSMVKAVLLKGSKAAFAWQKYNFKTLKATLIDYVQEELKLLPSHRHFELLQDEQLHLNERLDRLDARLNDALAV